MKNIFSVFRSDIQKIRGNVIAMIVLIGITLVPTLYAWFNIAGSWDPYENTGNLKVAVASEDNGYHGTLIPVSLNLGDQIISSLRANSQLGWTFTDADSAKKGVQSGTYYAAIVIPKGFSQKMMSIFSPDAQHPEIIYYINEKENAVVPKVTEKGASAVQQQINSTFIRTVSETTLDALALANNLARETGNTELAENLADSLSRISAELNSASGTVSSFSSMADAAASMLTTTGSFLEQAGSGTKSSLSALDSVDQTVTSLGSAVSGTTDAVNAALSQSSAFYTAVSKTADQALTSYSEDAVASAQTLSLICSRIDDLISHYSDIRDSLDSLAQSHPELPALSSGLRAVITRLDDAIARQNEIRDKIDQAASSLTGSTESISELKAEIDALIARTGSSLEQVRSDYETDVKENLNGLLSSLDSVSSDLGTFIRTLDHGRDEFSGAAGSAVSDLSSIRSALSESASLLSDCAEKLDKASLGIHSGDAEAVEPLSSLLAENPSLTAGFLSSPVSLDSHKLYPVGNYGSAMAPFYSTLAIWVGAVVMAAMLKTEVSPGIRKTLPGAREHQFYFGRLLLFLFIGLLQSTIICLGDLYFLRIQCLHPFLFIAAGWITSLVYVNIIYALTVSFGDIGKAIAVVLMVMQVAGSGGTFPIEVAPHFFQAAYPLLPFTHSMNAMRECIAGLYGTNYVKELLCLGAFLIPALLLGLLLRKPVIKLTHAFNEKLEETKLI